MGLSFIYVIWKSVLWAILPMSHTVPNKPPLTTLLLLILHDDIKNKVERSGSWCKNYGGTEKKINNHSTHSEFKFFKPWTFFITIRINLRGFLQLSFYLSFFSVMQIKDLVYLINNVIIKKKYLKFYSS